VVAASRGLALLVELVEPTVAVAVVLLIALLVLVEPVPLVLFYLSIDWRNFMQALIDPRVTDIQYIASWSQTSPSYPVYATYPNSARVCEVVSDASTFPVADPLFWTACPNNAVADQWYYNTVTSTVLVIQNAPPPQGQQAISTGTQTL
jgi:hypothetical protein